MLSLEYENHSTLNFEMINHFKVYHYLKNIFHFTRTTVEPGLYPREFHDLQMIRRYRDFFPIVLKEEIIVFRVFFFYNLFSFLSVQVDRIYSIDIYKFVLEISQRMWCLYTLVYCNQPFSIPSFVYKISTSLFSFIILCNLMPSVNNLSKSLFFSF